MGGGRSVGYQFSRLSICHAMILDGDGRWWDNLSLRSIAKIRSDLTACHNIAMASMYMIIGTCMQRGVK